MINLRIIDSTSIIYLNLSFFVGGLGHLLLHIPRKTFSKFNFIIICHVFHYFAKTLDRYHILLAKNHLTKVSNKI